MKSDRLAKSGRKNAAKIRFDLPSRSECFVRRSLSEGRKSREAALDNSGGCSPPFSFVYAKWAAAPRKGAQRIPRRARLERKVIYRDRGVAAEHPVPPHPDNCFPNLYKRRHAPKKMDVVRRRKFVILTIWTFWTIAQNSKLSNSKKPSSQRGQTNFPVNANEKRTLSGPFSLFLLIS